MRIVSAVLMTPFLVSAAFIGHVACKTPRGTESAALSDTVKVSRTVHHDMSKEFRYASRDLQWVAPRIGSHLAEGSSFEKRDIVAVMAGQFSLASRYEAVLDLILRTGGQNQQGSTLKVKTDSVRSVHADLKTMIRIFEKPARMHPRDYWRPEDIQAMKSAAETGLQLVGRISAALQKWGYSGGSQPPAIVHGFHPAAGPGPGVWYVVTPGAGNNNNNDNNNAGPQDAAPPEFNQPPPQPVVTMINYSELFERMSNPEHVRSMGLPSRNEFARIVKDNKDKSGQDYARAVITPFYKGDLETLLKASAGVSEGYTVFQHTSMVLQVFHSQRRTSKALYEVDQNKADVYYLMPAVMVLHDIGKAVAIAKGDKHLQHHFSVPIARNVLKAMGFTEKEVTLAGRLIGNDILGSAMVRAGTDMRRVTAQDMTWVAQALIKQSEGTGLYPEEFTDLQRLYYVSDAASYPDLRRNVFTSTQGPLCNQEGMICGRNGMLESIKYWTLYHSSNGQMEKPLTPYELYRKRTGQGNPVVQPAQPGQPGQPAGPVMGGGNQPANPGMGGGHNGNGGNNGNDGGSPVWVNPSPPSQPSPGQPPVVIHVGHEIPSPWH